MHSIYGVGFILSIFGVSLSVIAMAEERAAKLRRLTDLRRSLPHLSASALSAVLAEVREHGIPEGGSRWDLAQASEQALVENTPYGSVLDSVQLVSTGGKKPLKLEVVNFPAMLWMAFREGGRFSDLVRRSMVNHPCLPEKPWRLALYADEVVPGNPLSNENRRKIWVVYVSFLELGPAALSQEDNWFTLAVVRSKVLNTAAAGIGQLFRRLLHSLFGAQAKHDFSTAGMRLGLGDTAVRLWAVPGMFLQDGAAHKSTWHCKGDAGTKLCMLCRNLVSVDSGLTDEDGGQMLSCSLLHDAELDPATDDDIRGSVRRLAAHAATDSAVMFAKRQQAYGFVHQPEGLLLDRTLDEFVRPASMFVHDWMHAVFVNGIFQTVVYLTFAAVASDNAGDAWQAMAEYTLLWCWPRRVQHSGLKEIFSTKRATASRKAMHLKCTASEGLSIYGVIAYMVHAIYLKAGRAKLACTAFVALANVIDLLVAVPLRVVSPQQLKDNIQAFLDCVVKAGWRNHIHPKFHWLVHLPKHLGEFEQLPTCWTHERKHRVAKRYASDICNTTSFEKSVLKEMTAHHLWALKQASPNEVGLLEPKEPSQRLAGLIRDILAMPVDIRVAKEARSSEHITSCKGDVVFVRDENHLFAAEVWLHFEAGGTPLPLVSRWASHRVDVDMGVAEWAVEEQPMLLHTSAIVAPAIYTMCREGLARTLLPCQLRSAVLFR